MIVYIYFFFKPHRDNEVSLFLIPGMPFLP